MNDKSRRLSSDARLLLSDAFISPLELIFKTYYYAINDHFLPTFHVVI